ATKALAGFSLPRCVRSQVSLSRRCAPPVGTPRVWLELGPTPRRPALMNFRPPRASTPDLGASWQPRERSSRRLMARTALRVLVASTVLALSSCGSDSRDPSPSEQQSLDSDGDGVSDAAEGRDSALD